jgi:hypothetical protein
MASVSRDLSTAQRVCRSLAEAAELEPFERACLADAAEVLERVTRAGRLYELARLRELRSTFETAMELRMEQG